MLIMIILRKISLQNHNFSVKDLNSQKYNNQAVFTAQRQSTDLRQVLTTFQQLQRTVQTTPIQASQEQTWFIGTVIISLHLLILQQQTRLIQELTCSKIGLNSFQTLPICFMLMGQSVSTKSTKVEWEIVTGCQHLQLLVNGQTLSRISS